MREDDVLYSDTLMELLSKLKSEAHYIYAFLSGLPKKYFFLRRDYDAANDLSVCEDEDMENNMFTISEFYDRYDTFHPDDDFGFCFTVPLTTIDSDRAEMYNEYDSINNRDNATIEQLNKYLEKFLECYCERCLRDNHPFELTPDIIAQFGFTPDDVEKLAGPLTRHNTAAKTKILAEFEALNKLDFIRNRHNMPC